MLKIFLLILNEFCIDDIQKYYIAWGGIHTEYFSTNLINSKYYTFFVKFWQGVAGYQFTLSWNYPSLSSFSQIPMNNIFLPSLVSNSPYTINSAATVWGDGKRTGVETWDDANVNSGDGWSSTWTVESGYIWTGGSSTTKDVWSEMCGDGVRFNLISTYWDDKNTINGDGCSSTWTVESGFTWTGGSSTTKDTWTEICGDGVKFNTISTYWDDKNLVNKDGCSSSWTVETGFTWSGGSSSSKDICSTIFVVTAQEAAAAKSTQAAIGAGASMNIGVSLLNTSSPLGFFSMLNQFQLLYILLVSGAYISDGVFNLITGMSFALFNFNFINIKEINAFNFIYLWLSFEQTNVNLNKIGLVQ